MQLRTIHALDPVSYTQQVLQAYEDGFRPDYNSVEFSPRMIGFYFLAQFTKPDEVETAPAVETTEAPKRGRKATKETDSSETPEA